MSARLHCCYIEDQSALAALPEQTPENSAELHAAVRVLGCQEDGKIFEIWDGQSPDDFTHACRTHVGVMLDETKTSTIQLAQSALTR